MQWETFYNPNCIAIIVIISIIQWQIVPFMT